MKRNTPSIRQRVFMALQHLQRLISSNLRLSRPISTSPVSNALNAILKQDAFTIIQIGAHVGNTLNDPLFTPLRNQLNKRKGRLILVEPDKQHFDALQHNYRYLRNVSFENVAISDKPGPACFYKLGVNPVDYGFPAWLDQLGSLKAERMEELWDKYEANPRYKAFYLQHRVVSVVNCITFHQLLHRHNIASIDLLQIDAEGYELEILKTIDFIKTPIRFINYERVLLHGHTFEAEAIVQQNGYSLIHHHQDTFCYKPSEPLFCQSKTP